MLHPSAAVDYKHRIITVIISINGDLVLILPGANTTWCKFFPLAACQTLAAVLLLLFSGTLTYKEVKVHCTQSHKVKIIEARSY